MCYEIVYDWLRNLHEVLDAIRVNFAWTHRKQILVRVIRALFVDNRSDFRFSFPSIIHGQDLLASWVVFSFNSRWLSEKVELLWSSIPLSQLYNQSQEKMNKHTRI